MIAMLPVISSILIVLLSIALGSMVLRRASEAVTIARVGISHDFEVFTQAARAELRRAIGEIERREAAFRDERDRLIAQDTLIRAGLGQIRHLDPEKETRP